MRFRLRHVKKVENCLLTKLRASVIKLATSSRLPASAAAQAVEAESESPLPPETSFWQSGNSLTPPRSVRCMKGVCCHDPLAFLIVPSLFRAPSYPASAAGRPSAGCLQPADLSGGCGYPPPPQINTTANIIPPAPSSNLIAASPTATPTVGAPPGLESDCKPTPSATSSTPCLGVDCTLTSTATPIEIAPPCGEFRSVCARMFVPSSFVDMWSSVPLLCPI